MRQIIWTNFAISELKNIYLYYRIVASDKVADKIRKSIFDGTKPLIKQPLIGAVEENLTDLGQGHRYIVTCNQPTEKSNFNVSTKLHLDLTKLGRPVCRNRTVLSA